MLILVRIATSFTYYENLPHSLSVESGGRAGGRSLIWWQLTIAQVFAGEHVTQVHSENCVFIVIQ